MKNTQFAMLIAIVGFFGMFASASAQILPASTLIASKGNLVAINPNTSGTLTPAIDVNVAPISAAVIDTAIPVSVIGQNNPPLTPAIDLTAVYPNGNTIAINGVVPAIQPVVPVQEPAPTPTPTPTPASSGGTGIISTGQHMGGGLYGAQIQPVAQTYAQSYSNTTPVASAPKVVYKTVYKDAPTKEQIPLLDESVDSVVSRDVSSQHAASTFGLGGISLVGVLGAIAVILVIMVAVQEYTLRKRYEAAARMHAHA